MRPVLRPLRVEDIPPVQEIEREAFPTLWPPTPFKREMDNRLVRYLVAYVPREEAPPVPSVEPPKAVNGNRPLLARVLNGVKQLVVPETPASVSTDLIVGFVGLWFMVDEAHITAIAVRTQWRGHGIGELLLVGAIQLASERHSRVVTLEARVSNVVAQALYEKYGFRKMGVRRGYYTDNHEDAVIMTTDPIYTEVYQGFFHTLVQRYEARYGAITLSLPG